MSTPSKFPATAMAKKAGWFSRRHETNSAHQDEQERIRIARELRREREDAVLVAATAKHAAARVKAKANVKPV